MVTLEQISTALEHPFVLLLVGAGVSGGLVTWFTHWLENRRKKREIEVENNRKGLEIKVDIASKMAECIGHLMASTAILVHRKKTKFDDKEIDSLFYDNMEKWLVDSSTLNSKFEGYFSSDTSIRERWIEYTNVLTPFYSTARLYFLEPRTERENTGLRANLEIIRDYLKIKAPFSDNQQTNWDRLTTELELTYDKELWSKVGLTLTGIGDQIIKDVLKLPIKVF